MRVLQLIDTLGFGGAQRLLATLVEARSPLFDSVVAGLSAPWHQALIEQIEATHGRVIKLSGKGLLDLKRLRRLTALLRQERIDVIHAHLAYATILGGLAGRLVGVPMVVTLHDTPAEHPYYHPVRSRLESWSLQFVARQVIVSSPTLATLHAKRLPKAQLSVIPPAVTISPPLTAAERVDVRTQLVGTAQRPILIAVGRLTPSNGYPDLLAAFAQARETHTEAALLIVGSGMLYGQLEEQVKLLGLENHVYLLGGRADVGRLLAASDVYVNCSYSETAPIAILEAMAAGLPVIATQVGEAARIVTPSVGMIVPPKSPPKLAEALTVYLHQLADLPQRGQMARAYVAQHYSPENWAKQLAALYASVASAR